MIIDSAIQKIIDDDSAVQPGEEKLAALTAGDRVSWAKARREFFAKGLNRVSLQTIEGAAFVLALDDDDFLYTPVSSQYHSTSHHNFNDDFDHLRTTRATLTGMSRLFSTAKDMTAGLTSLLPLWLERTEG